MKKAKTSAAKGKNEHATDCDEYRDPSPESLREIPEVDLTKGTWARNPYAMRIAREGAEIVLPGRGRPKKGSETGTIPRSVRFPPHVWEGIEQAAQAQGLSLHAALRTAIVEWMGRNEKSKGTTKDAASHHATGIARSANARKPRPRSSSTSYSTAPHRPLP
jgi:hypothetical protein